jgi:hypothetical protein
VRSRPFPRQQEQCRRPAPIESLAPRRAGV